MSCHMLDSGMVQLTAGGKGSFWESFREIWMLEDAIERKASTPGMWVLKTMAIGRDGGSELVAAIAGWVVTGNQVHTLTLSLILFQYIHHEAMVYSLYRPRL